jgi:hypothetical protein
VNWTKVQFNERKGGDLGTEPRSATYRERQAKLLKALLDDEDFRARAGSLIFGSIYDTYVDTPGETAPEVGSSE